MTARTTSLKPVILLVSLLTLVTIAAGIVGWTGPAAMVGGNCDHEWPETLGARVCGICEAAQGKQGSVYFLKDNSSGRPTWRLELPKTEDT